jgi:uncharacterized protein (TIGR03067 family)
MRLCCCLAVLLAGSALAAPVPKELRKPDDKVAILGKWEIARANVNGKEVAKYFPEHTMTFRRDGTVVFEYPNGDTPQVLDWTLDPTETPKRFRCKMQRSEVSSSYRYAFREGRLVLAHTLGLKSVPDDLAPVPGISVVEYRRAGTK